MTIPVPLTFFINLYFFNFLILKCFILQNKEYNRDKTKDSTYNITDTKENKNKIKHKGRNIKLTLLSRQYKLTKAD